jgi:Na+/pantothenate symporter
MLRPAIRYLIMGLGFFEFFVVYRLLNDSPSVLQAELSYYPTHFFTDTATKYLSCTFTAFLGLIRIVWAAGNNSLLSWMGIVAAHTVELIFLWSLASMPHFDHSGSNSLVELIQKVQSGKIGHAKVNVILFVVPVLLLLLVFHGPGGVKSRANKSKNQ